MNLEARPIHGQCVSEFGGRAHSRIAARYLVVRHPPVDISAGWTYVH